MHKKQEKVQSFYKIKVFPWRLLTLGADEKSDILQDFQSYTYYIYREKGSDAWIMQILLDVGDMVDMFYHDSRVNL